MSAKAVAFILVLVLFVFFLRHFDLNKLKCLYLRLRGLRFLVAGPEMIEEAYAKARGKSFVVPTPANDHLMITSSDLIEELINAPHKSLSLHAIAKEILQPKHTIYGFEWQDQRGVEGTGFVRAIRSVLTSQLPRFQPQIEATIRSSLRDELLVFDSDVYASVKLFPMIKRIVAKINCFVFFGQELSSNAEFTKAALEFPQVVIFAAECLRVTPTFLCPFVASLATGQHRAAKTLFRHLEPVVIQRLANRAAPGDTPKATPVDCMQWLIETSPRKTQWSPARMIGEIMAVWFSTVHQLAMATTYIVEDLCLHSEYVTPLRRELNKSTAERAGAPRNVEELPLLDSFIKESVRYTNADAVSCRRKALHDYVFQDGSILRKNDWVCVPQRAMMRDERRYHDARQFDGFRFAKANECIMTGNPTSSVPDKFPATLTTANLDWPIWGLGNTAW